MTHLHDFRLNDEDINSLAPSLLDCIRPDYLFNLALGEKESERAVPIPREMYLEALGIVDRDERFYRDFSTFYDWHHVDFGFLAKRARKGDVIACFETVNGVLSSLCNKGQNPLIISQDLYLHNQDSIEDEGVLPQINGMASYILASEKFGDLVEGALSRTKIAYEFGNIPISQYTEIVGELKRRWSVEPISETEKFVAFPFESMNVFCTIKPMVIKYISERFPESDGFTITSGGHYKDSIRLVSYSNNQKLVVPRSYPFTHIKSFEMGFTYA